MNTTNTNKPDMIEQILWIPFLLIVVPFGFGAAGALTILSLEAGRSAFSNWQFAMWCFVWISAAGLIALNRQNRGKHGKLIAMFFVASIILIGMFGMSSILDPNGIAGKQLPMPSFEGSAGSDRMLDSMRGLIPTLIVGGSLLFGLIALFISAVSTWESLKMNRKSHR